MARKHITPRERLVDDSLHCVTCAQRLPPGKEPEYFGQGSIGYRAEMEVQRAAEDVSQFLRYAQTVNSAVWDMLQIADVKPSHLSDPGCYLNEAVSLCFLLTDLVEETQRRVATLAQLVRQEVNKEERSRSRRRREGGLSDGNNSTGL
jgi:hypothetical protein